MARGGWRARSRASLGWRQRLPLRPIGANLLVRDPTGALSEIDKAGARVRTLVPAASQARVLHADGGRGLVLVGCHAQTPASLQLFGREAKPLLPSDPIPGCANGADPCSTQPCPTSYTCPTGYTCNNQRCWPTGGAGGGGGSSRTGGAGGGGGGAGGTSGTGGTGGMTGTGQAGVRCLNALCNTGQVCCVSQSSSTPTLTCTSQAECAGDFAVTCDGPEDCGGAGHQCCMPSGAIMETACVTGNCLAGLAMCHSRADCAANESCCSVSTFGYTHGFCQTGTCTR